MLPIEPITVTRKEKKKATELPERFHVRPRKMAALSSCFCHSHKVDLNKQQSYRLVCGMNTFGFSR